MNILPPFTANTRKSNHPAQESIAAYLDGRLPESERRAMASHLDKCAACYEIYTESVRFQNDDTADVKRKTLAFEPRKTRLSPSFVQRIAWPLAALLLIGVGAVVWHQLHLPIEPQKVEVLAAALDKPSASMIAQLGPFDTTRGGEPDEPDTNFPVVAFQSGATLIDLRVAIETGDPEKVNLVAGNLRVLYHAGAIFEEERKQAEITATVEGLENGTTHLRQARLTTLRKLETTFRSLYSNPLTAPHFELGVWTEAGRLAAYGERMAFFSAKANRTSLRRFRRQPPIPEVKEALDRIEDAWPEGSFTAAQKAKLTEHFDEVIGPYDVSLTEE